MIGSHTNPNGRRTYLTIPEASEYLSVSQRTLYRWLRDGKLRCFRVGNITRIAVPDLETFVQQNTGTGVAYADDNPY